MFTILVAWVLAHASARADDLFVTGDRVNLRSGPGEGFEVMGQVQKGDRLGSADESNGEWIAVVPPLHLSVYVYKDLVSDGRVIVPRLRVRGGPGITYRPVGVVEEGAELVVRGVSGDWLDIEPPDGTRVWIHQDYVSAQPAGAGGDRRTVVERKDVDQAVVEVERAGPPAPVAPVGVRQDVRPRATPGAETPAGTFVQPVNPRPYARAVLPVDGPLAAREPGVSYTGVLRTTGVGFWRQPTRLRLVTFNRSGRSQTVCYVVGDETAYADLIGQPVRVEGIRRELAGAKHPVVEPLHLERLGVSVE